jgi:2-oxoglutarate/2-oxoacid ferredoxin oxidoreductase subunit alpha
MALDMTVLVGVEAGQGLLTIGFVLAKMLSRGGYHIFGDQDYESRIRGGHYFFRARISDAPVRAVKPPIDILLALNAQTVQLHKTEMSPYGIIVADPKDAAQSQTNSNLFAVPLNQLAEEAGGRIMLNTVSLGVLTCLLDYDLSLLNTVLNERFSGETAQANLKAARGGFDFASANFKGTLQNRLKPFPSASFGTGQTAKRFLINGNEAIAYGALAAGCRFLSAYPMTPSTPIIEFMAERADKFGAHVIQPEDEISAVNMAIGAAFAGARAMTVTSGSGFCLMVEGLGLSGMTEMPLVVVDGQRPGPCVGFPTRTEQGDLSFVLTAHHGEFPRVVLAPGSVEEAFKLTARAFNLAEKYQCPVIILNDQHLGESYATAEPFDISSIKIERGDILSQSESDKASATYMRHRITPSGISPRALPGIGKSIVVTDSDEHDEAGHLTESAAERIGQVEKRLRKLEGLASEIVPPTIYGNKDANLKLVGWGSTLGALKEAADNLNADGKSASMLHLSQLWPFPSEIVSRFMSSGRSVVVESNATGQLAKLIRQETGIKAGMFVRKYDGRPMTPAIILDALKAVKP